MKVRPQKHYRTPKYPTADKVHHCPELLKTLPYRWHTRPAVCAALTFTLTSGLYSCGSQMSDTPDAGVIGAALSDNGMNGLSDGDEAIAGVNVPLFEFGDGRGGFGCVSVTAPVFMSEDEAAQIIADEAAKYGVDIRRKTAPTVSDAEIPETSFGHYDDLSTVKGELKTDGRVEGTSFAVEFVSKDDYREWEAKDKTPLTTFSTYDIKDAAKRLAENNLNVAAFYDPVANSGNVWEKYDEWLRGYLKTKGLDPEKDAYSQLPQSEHEKIDRKWSEIYDECEAEAIRQAESDLREQVRGFIEWLKGQDII